ncbi:MAG: hypothetical protein O9294_13795 [Cytophagales bacterium]|jgi:hypothetical protein|nr:hypothetical protein [Cytophagales bacterium]
MKKILLTLFGLIIFVSDDNGQIQKQRDIGTLVQGILDLPRLQWIYHPEASERLPVKVLASGLVTKDLKLKKFDKPVLVLTKDELELKKIPDYVNFKKLEFKGDTVTFYLTYDIEGAFADGKLFWTGDKWVVRNYRVGEY